MVVVWPELSRAAEPSSGHGPFAGIPFTCSPVVWSSRAWNLRSSGFLLLRRLWCPFPLSAHFCRCGRRLDVRGHHRSACGRAGVLGRRGFPLESAAARGCGEARRGSQSTSAWLTSISFPQGGSTTGRLRLWQTDFPLFHGAQLAVDATLVSPVRGDGSDHDGAALPASTTPERKHLP